jgi:hypothetical protein
MHPSTRPRAPTPELIILELPEKVLLYDLDRPQAHCINQMVAFV